jgi:hypothetical protein
LHSGTICKNYNAHEVTQIGYLPDGVWSKAPYATGVVCPLVTQNYGEAIHGAIVYVYVWHYDAQRTTECQVATIGPADTVAFSPTQTAQGQGVHELWFPLAGADTGFSSRAYNVYCSIPKFAYGKILGIDLVD